METNANRPYAHRHSWISSHLSHYVPRSSGPEREGERSIIIFHNGNQAAVILLNKSSNESVRIWKKQTCCFCYKIILLITKFALGTSHFMLMDNITFGDKLDNLKTSNACP